MEVVAHSDGCPTQFDGIRRSSSGCRRGSSSIRRCTAGSHGNERTSCARSKGSFARSVGCPGHSVRRPGRSVRRPGRSRECSAHFMRRRGHFRGSWASARHDPAKLYSRWRRTFHHAPSPCKSRGKVPACGSRREVPVPWITLSTRPIAHSLADCREVGGNSRERSRATHRPTAARPLLVSAACEPLSCQASRL
jgi:hypothetical protein